MRCMNRLKIAIAVVCFSFFLCLSGQGQQGLELGSWLGAGYYFGDLNTEFDLSKPGLAGGAILRYNLNNRISMRLGGNFTRIHADDLDSENDFERRRGLNLTNNIFEVAGLIELNFFPYIHGSPDNSVTPYMFIGASTSFHNPKATYNGTTYRLRDLGTEGQLPGEEYSTSVPALLYGGGLKIDLNEDWSLNFEATFRSLFTDYLDDVSTTYPEADELIGLRGSEALIASNPSSELMFPGIEGTQRGNAEDNDSYATFGISLVYYFGTLRCPKISRN